MKRISLVGERYGQLTALEMLYGGRVAQVKCRCDCGTEFVARAGNVRGGNTTSCGCINRANRTHGMTGSKTYKSWLSMHGRCKGQSSDPIRYVAKGVTVCPEWSSFERFLEDMGLRPNGMTLDRFPNADGNYEPGNCRWATMAQQTRNRSSNIVLTHQGETKCLRDWATSLGINYGTAVGRHKRGMPTSLILAPTRHSTRGWKRSEAADV